MGFDLITKKSFVQGCEDHPIHHLPYVRFSACLLAWCVVKTQMEAGGQTRESVCIIFVLFCFQKNFFFYFFFFL